VEGSSERLTRRVPTQWERWTLLLESTIHFKSIIPVSYWSGSKKITGISVLTVHNGLAEDFGRFLIF